jgi:GMP synthase (glutamine-hydrolysing)
VRALAIVHQSDAGPGVFADGIRERGFELEEWSLPEAPEPPRPLADFGGAMHADQEEVHPWLGSEKLLLAELIERRTPLLGVCLGAQLVAAAAGGQARRLAEPEIGWFEVELTPEGTADPVLGSLPERFEAFQWHSYEFTLPPGAVALAWSAACLQAFRTSESAWVIQFHPEVTAADAEAWTRDYRADEDAVRIGLDPDALSRETATRIDEWNELGRGLAGRFVDHAARSYSGVT